MLISFDVFKYGKRNALTMSYDDASACNIKLVEIFNKYGVKSTFHINSGLLDDMIGCGDIALSLTEIKIGI